MDKRGGARTGVLSKASRPSNMGSRTKRKPSPFEVSRGGSGLGSRSRFGRKRGGKNVSRHPGGPGGYHVRY